MGKTNIVVNMALFLCFACLIVAAVYVSNLWFPSRYHEVWGITLDISVTDLFFLEGVIFILLGLLLFVGSGGINRWTVETMLKSSIADWIYGKERNKNRVKPTELFLADRWKPKGFPRVSLTLLLSGILMVLIYFLRL